MMPPLQIRPVLAADIPAVLAIQAQCYDEARIESDAAFLAKIAAAPACCFLALAAGAPVGYLFALPALADSPPPLDSADCAIPARPDCLYLHDLSVAPAARGLGVAEALVRAFLGQLRAMGLGQACLTAVNGAGPYWQRFGFEAVTPDAVLAAKLATYGEGAAYMRLRV